MKPFSRLGLKPFSRQIITLVLLGLAHNSSDLYGTTFTWGGGDALHHCDPSEEDNWIPAAMPQPTDTIQFTNTGLAGCNTPLFPGSASPSTEVSAISGIIFTNTASNYQFQLNGPLEVKGNVVNNTSLNTNFFNMMSGAILTFDNGASTNTLNLGKLSYSVGPGAKIVFNGSSSGSGSVGLFGANSQLNTGTGSGTITLSELSNTGATSSINIGSGFTIAFGSANTNLAFAGPITGAGNLTKQGTGTQQVTLSNTLFTGNVTVSSGILQAGVADIFINATSFTIGSTGTFDLNGHSNTINNLSGPTGNPTITFGSIPDSAILTIGQSTNGVFVGAITGGSTNQLIKNDSGTLTLSGASTYGGGTTIAAGTLALSGSGSLSSTGSVTLDASSTFDISAATSPVTIGDLISTSVSNNAIVNLGTQTLNTGTNTGSTFDGVFEGSGLINKTGTGILSLGNSSTGFTGSVQISAGTIKATTTNVLSGSTSFAINSGATFNMNDHDNAIGSLSGAGTINLGAVGGHTLTINEYTNSTFSGSIAATPGNVDIEQSGTLTVTNSGGLAYSGTTTIGGNATLEAGGFNTLPFNSVVTLNASGTLSNPTSTSNSIAGLSSSSTLSTLNLGSSTGSISITGAGSSTFDGAIVGTGTGLLSITGGYDLTLGGTNNTYSQTTNLTNGTLTAGNNGVFSPNSPVNISAISTLDLNGFNNSIASLSGPVNASVTLGAGTLTLASPTATSTTYSGTITGTGGLVIGSNNTLTLNTAVAYTGSTTINGTLIAGVVDVIATSSSVTLGAVGTFNLNGFDNTINTLSGASGSTITLGSNTLTVIQKAPGTFAGVITGTASTGSLVLDATSTSTLTLSGVNTYGGGTTIDGGTLALSGNGTIINSVVVNSPGKFDISGKNSSLTITSLDGTGNTFLGANKIIVGANTLYSGVISGTGSLEKIGAGIFSLGGANTYTGGTEINGGTLALTAGGSLSPNGPLQVDSGATFDITAATSPQQVGDLSGSGTITLGSKTLNTNTTGSTVYSGAINGTGGFGMIGSGHLFLSGPKAYSGGTTIAGGGTLEIDGDSSLGLSGTSVTASGVGGTLQIDATIVTSRSFILNTGANLAIDTNGNNMTANGVITGGGSLTKEGNGTLILTALNNYSGGTTISGGTLQGDTNSLQGNIIDNSVLTFNQGFDGTFNGTISGTGIINKNAGGNLTFNTNQSGFSGTTNVNAGTLTLNNFLGGNVDVFSGATLQGNGTIGGNVLVFSGGTISPGNSIGIGRININGNFTLQTNGVYIWDANSPSQTDFINVGGNANIGGTLNIQFSGTPVANVHYPILHSNGGVFGTFNSILNEPVSPTPFLMGGVFYTPNDIYFAFQSIFANFAATGNAENVAIQVDSISNPTADELLIINALLSLTPAELNAALNEMAGEQYTFLIQEARYSNERLNQAIYNSLRNTLIPCWCPSECDRIQTWAMAETGHCFASRDINSAGLKTTNWAFTIGGHVPVRSGLIMGIAASYQRDYLNFHQGGHTSRDTGQAAIYGAARGDVFYLYADGIFGMTTGKFNRPIIFDGISRVAKSKPQTTQGIVYAEAGLNFCTLSDEICGCWSSLLVQPFLGTEYGHYVQKRFVECGAGSLDLTFKQNIMNTFDSYLGMHLFGTIACVNLSADIMWQHAFNYHEIKTIERFDFGTNFTIKGTKLGHDGLKACIHAAIPVTDNINVYADVFGERWQHWYSHGADLGIAAWW